jgi:hypothetical protein
VHTGIPRTAVLEIVMLDKDIQTIAFETYPYLSHCVEVAVFDGVVSHNIVYEIAYGR